MALRRDREFKTDYRDVGVWCPNVSPGYLWPGLSTGKGEGGSENLSVVSAQEMQALYSGHAVNPSMGAWMKHPCFIQS